jgi:anthranilate synthase component 1
MIRKAKNYVYDGDVLQVVISKRFEASYSGDFDSFYERLKETNPSPYMYYLDFDDAVIVGSSPEMLVRINKKTIETFPIAGTRPIVADEEKNIRYKKELLADKKEQAEHVMLVDLARNDIGKICEHGSIEIPEYMAVERYSHVQHIVSHVTGIVAEKYDAFDALAAVFPAGTVSGAPKVRAMEIIDELETVRRGPYAGAVGYFSFNGNMDLAITIRTLFANKNKLVVQSGAGIVADSNPKKEWYETENKAKALLVILGEAHENGGMS